MNRDPIDIQEFGPFRLIPSERQLIRDGLPVALTPKAFDLLAVLVENAGSLVSKRELLDRVWPDSFVEEANLSVKMSELRRALGETAAEPSFIETVPRNGYRFIAEVKRAEESRFEDIPPDDLSSVDISEDKRPSLDKPEQTTAIPSVSPGRRRWLWLLLLLPIAAALSLFLDVGGVRDRFSGAAPSGTIRSIAVLPLENLSGDPTQEYFADGMTDALITDLAKVRALRVISRPSVMKYKAAHKSPAQVGKELSIDAVLIGSVLRSGDRVRIAVQLFDTVTEQNLWTDSYERDLRDVLALQRDVTRDIVDKIRVTLSPQERSEIGNSSPVNPVAYDHYLRGKYYLNRQTRADNVAAIAALEAAVAADPSYALGHAELAQAYVWKLFLFDPNEEQLAEKAFMAAEKALSLDPDLAVAYLARGRSLWTPKNRFPHERAIREYRRALEIDPNLDEARNQLALVYNHVGALDEALTELQRAVETNPSNSLAQFRIGETQLFQGNYEPALATLRGVPSEVNPSLVGHQIVWALWNLGRTEEASATLHDYLAKYPEDNRGLLTSIEAVFAGAAGREVEAEEKIRIAVEKGKGFGHFHHTAYQIACAYAQMNKPEEAVRYLEWAANEGFPCYPLFLRDSNLDKIRNDAKFKAFLVTLEKQWQAYKTLL